MTGVAAIKPVDPLPFGPDASLYKAVLDSAVIGVVISDRQHRIIYSNPAFHRMSGYAAEFLDGASLFDMAPGGESYSHEDEFKRLWRGEIDSFGAEYPFTRRDGRKSWAALTASVRRDNTGAIEHTVLQFADIDQRKKAEAELAYSESRLNHALEAAGQGVWDHDIRRDRMYYSRMWRRMRGFGDDEEVDGAQEAWLSRVHPDDRDRIKAVVGQQDVGADGYGMLEYRERHRDGHYVWILSRGKPVEWDKNGRPIRTLGTDTDITHLKEIEARLATEKETLRVTLQSIADGVISTDTSGNITFMNAAAEEMTGWRSAAAEGHAVENIFASMDEAGLPAPSLLRACLANASERRVAEEHLLTGRDGQTRHVRESAAPLRMSNGELAGAVMVFQDTSAAHELQAELAYAASHDSLTGLPNRLAFDTALDAAVKARISGFLGLIDLDRFKTVNDTSGHAAGDALLKAVVSRIRQCVGKTDEVARIGGDEFAIIFNDCTKDRAIGMGRDIVASISELTFAWEGRTHRIGASIGLTAIGGEIVNADALYRRADKACYNAKGAGRGRVVIL